jgi:hypothetical protein
MIDAKPSRPEKNPDLFRASRGGMSVTDWKTFERNTLKGFFTLTLPSGLIIHDVALHERSGSRWISLPAREFIDKQGKKSFRPFLEFTDRGVAEVFREQALGALDRSCA